MSDGTSPRPGGGSQVSLPTWVFVAASLCLVAALVVVGFLAGRLTAIDQTAVTSSAGTPAIAIAHDGAAAVDTGHVDEAPRRRGPAERSHRSHSASSDHHHGTVSASSSRPVADSTAEADPRTEMAAAQAVSSAREDRERRAEREKADVTRYFQRLDRTLRLSKVWDDPNQFANELMARSQQGDPGGFDELIGNYQQLLERLDSITAPPACTQLHSAQKEVVRDGISMLQFVQRMMVSPDLAALAGLSQRVNSMQSRAEKVDALANDIKSRYRISD